MVAVPTRKKDEEEKYQQEMAFCFHVHVCDELMLWG